LILNVTASETPEMNVALLTPTYGRDLELCTLLCESVDRHVTSFSKHYLLVPDCDLSLFSHLASERREVLPASKFLPNWLRPLPRIVQRKRRQYWWSLRTKPVSGWHVQQYLKIAATMSLPHQRYCILDSDVVFFRNFDLSRYEFPNSIPLLNVENEVTSEQIRHARWVETSHELLGLPTPPLPASDFIGHIIFWDQQTTRRHQSSLGRSPLPDPGILGVHAVRLFRAERRKILRHAHTHPAYAVHQLLGSTRAWPASVEPVASSRAQG
jgi:hypothetical protein